MEKNIEKIKVNALKIRYVRKSSMGSLTQICWFHKNFLTSIIADPRPNTTCSWLGLPSQLFLECCCSLHHCRFLPFNWVLKSFNSFCQKFLLSFWSFKANMWFLILLNHREWSSCLYFLNWPLYPQSWPLWPKSLSLLDHE